MSVSLGFPSPEEGSRWDFVRGAILVAARSAGLQAIDGPFLQISNLDGLRASAQRAREFGFDGKWALHPDQIEPLDEIFSPSAGEVEQARAIVAALLGSEGSGAVILDGEMVDEASRKRAELVIARAEAAHTLDGPHSLDRVLRLMAGGAERVAVIDIGTNSTRLLIADVRGDSVEEVERKTTVTRLGRGVDVSGQLSSSGVERVCETVASYVALHEELGAEEVRTIATSAVRDASNGEAFVAELRERFALSAEVLDGAEEARLTYLGATAGRPPTDPTVVVDIGGGSTELVVGTGSKISFSTSLQVGVVRQTERRISSDPPSATELDGLAGEIESALDEAIASRPDAHANAGIGVAGTPTSLAAIELELDPYDPERVHGHELALPAVQKMLARLATVSVGERAAITGLHSDRAPTIVAGVVILIEVMRSFGLEEITVSEHDILYGAAIEAAGAGAGRPPPRRR